MKDINNPLVSISCITYNHAAYIRQCLDGFIMQQTDFAYEVLIHDDCSTDGTTEIIREYAEKYPDVIKPMYETENQYSQGKPIGTSVWNLPRAKGTYVAICEGDDYWTDPLKLQKQVDILEAHSEMVCCYTNYGTVDKNNQMIEWPNHNKNISRSFTGDNFRELINGMYMQTLTILYRKDVLESLDYQGGIDYSLALACALMGKCSYLKDVTANYRLHNASATHTAMDYVRTASLKAWEYYVELYLSKTQYRRPLWEHLLICGTIDACLISKKRYGGVNAEQADRVLKHHPELKKYMWLGVLYRLRHIIVKRFK